MPRGLIHAIAIRLMLGNSLKISLPEIFYAMSIRKRGKFDIYIK